MLRKDYESVFNEPSRSGRGEDAPSEGQPHPSPSDEAETISTRDSAFLEPWSQTPESKNPYREWLEAKRAQRHSLRSWGYVLLAALIAGPFAVLSAIKAEADSNGYGSVLLIILFAPVVEEILKQSGAIYLLEKRPYDISTPIQIVVCAVISAFIFATIENALYINVYYRSRTHSQTLDYETFIFLRHYVCTSMHVLSSFVASFGLIRAWNVHRRDAKPFDLADAYSYFVAAMVIHGAYNASAMILWS